MLLLYLIWINTDLIMLLMTVCLIESTNDSPTNTRRFFGSDSSPNLPWGFVRLKINGFKKKQFLVFIA